MQPSGSVAKKQLSVYMCAHAYMCVHMHACVYVYTYICMHVHTYVYIWNPIDFQGHRSKVKVTRSNFQVRGYATLCVALVTVCCVIIQTTLTGRVNKFICISFVNLYSVICNRPYVILLNVMFSFVLLNFFQMGPSWS